MGEDEDSEAEENHLGGGRKRIAVAQRARWAKVKRAAQNVQGSLY
jgi:hypothetical protein